MLSKLFSELKRLPRYAILLAALTALGMTAGLYRLYAGLGATTNMSKVFPWGVWISFDLTTVALSGGAFTLAALVYVFHMHDLHAATRPTVLFGLLGYSSVLVILFFDLGRWDRFWHFIVYPNINSALFEVSWCIAIYSIILIYEFSPVIVERFGNNRLLEWIKKLTIPMVIAGITLSSMHQSSLGTLFIVMSPRLHPLWHSMLLPVFFLLSSIPAGISLIIIGSIVSELLFGHSLSQRVLEKLGWLMPWFLGLYLALKLGELLVTEELGLLFSSGKYSLLFWLELVVGVIVPMILFSIKSVRWNRWGTLTAAMLVAAGIVLNRFDATWFAILPRQGVTYSPHWLELALLVGVASGVLLVFTILSTYFPVFVETMPTRKPQEAAVEAGRAERAPALSGD